MKISILYLGASVSMLITSAVSLANGRLPIPITGYDMLQYLFADHAVVL